MMNLNNKEHPEYLELDSQRNIGIVYIKQMERVEKALYVVAEAIGLLIAVVIYCTL